MKGWIIMKKKFFRCICALLLFSMLTSIMYVVYASTPAEDDCYSYFIDGVQVTQADYLERTRNCSEVEEIREVSESIRPDYGYYIVGSDGFEQVSQEEYYAIVGTESEIMPLDVGTWKITNSVIAPGQTKVYWKGSGGDFNISSDEYIQLTINPVSSYRDRHLSVGYEGTSSFMEPITLLMGRGAKIAFIDRITAGLYRVLIKNPDTVSETINGDISVLKRP